MSKLYVTGLENPSKVIQAIKGVRAAGNIVRGPQLPDTLKGAKSIIDELRTTGEPQLLGESDDLAKLESAQNILADHGVESQRRAEPEVEAAPDSPEGVFKREARYSYEACKLAILCMTFGRGNPSVALTFAHSTAYAATTPEIQDRFNEAAAVLQDCFVDGSDPSVPTVVG